VTRNSIKVVMTTMGQANPAHVSERKDYKWNGDPGKSEAARTARPEGAPAVTEERAKRLEEFAGYLDQGLTAVQAGRLLGVEPRTARTYEREVRALRGAAS
jgi:hypothetical protein